VYLVDDGNKIMVKDYEGRLISEFKCPKGASSVVKLDPNGTLGLNSCLAHTFRAMPEPL